MSFSNPQSKNPAQRFMQWKGGEDGGGRLVYYDKDAKEEVDVKLPFGFTVLDEFSTVTGFNKKEHAGFWSNEVRNLMNEKLIVRTKSGVVAQGLYGDIKESIQAKGAKYAKSVYVAFKDEDGELVIGNIKFMGASLTKWIEFQKLYDVTKVGVKITKKPKKEKNGSNEYFVPVFEALELSKTTIETVKSLDQELQVYIGTYLSRKPNVDDDDLVDEDEDVEIEDTDVEITDKGAKKTTKKSKSTDDEDEDELDLEEIPF